MLKKKFLPSPLNFVKGEAHHTPKPIRIPRGLFVVALFIRVVWQAWMLRRGANDGLRSLGRLVRREFERLGGFWIKAGQVLATSEDALPRAFCEELAEIRDETPGFSGEIAKKILQTETGRPANDLFREFDVVPIARSSFGQIHMAWLRENDVKVAIKIQRPGMREAFLADLERLGKLASLLQFFSVCEWANLKTLEERMRHMAALKLDYRESAQTMRRIRRELKMKKVYVPEVFLQYCAPRVLVMEFIDGVPMAEYERFCASGRKETEVWCRDNGIRDEKLRQRVAKLARISPQGLGWNIMVLRDNRIALVDIDRARTEKLAQRTRSEVNSPLTQI